MKKITNLLLILTLSVVLTACGSGGSGGSGGGGDDDGGTPIKAKLLDSAIQGVYYITDAGSSGETDSNGEFNCISGELVEFYLPSYSSGLLYLGETKCYSIITPIELVTEGAKRYTTEISSLTVEQSRAFHRGIRLLQTLDSDSNPSNGITILPIDVQKLVDMLEDQDPEFDMEDSLYYALIDQSVDFDTALAQLATDIGGGRVAVSEVDALAHFNATLTTLNNTNNPQLPVVASYKGYSNTAQGFVEIDVETAPTGNSVLAVANMFYFKDRSDDAPRPFDLAVYEPNCHTSGTTTYSMVLLTPDIYSPTAVSLTISADSVIAESHTIDKVAKTRGLGSELSINESKSCINGKVYSDSLELYANGKMAVMKKDNGIYIGVASSQVEKSDFNFTRTRENAVKGTIETGTSIVNNSNYTGLLSEFNTLVGLTDNTHPTDHLVVYDVPSNDYAVGVQSKSLIDGVLDSTRVMILVVPQLHNGEEPVGRSKFSIAVGN